MSMNSQPEIAVRRGEATDAEDIGRLLHEFNSEFDEPTPGADALVGEGPDGLAVLRFRPALWSQALECYVAELYVVPRKRGRGLGRALMEAAIDRARESGADHIDLATSEDDIAARALYESLGFSNRERGADGPLSFLYERGL